MDATNEPTDQPAERRPTPEELRAQAAELLRQAGAAPPQAADPRNPTQKYYSGLASMVLAVASLLVLTLPLAIAALVCGVVAAVTGGKLDNPRLRGEGWIGMTIAGLILLVYVLMF